MFSLLPVYWRLIPGDGGAQRWSPRRRERSSHSSHRVENVRRAWFILAVTTREVARAVPTRSRGLPVPRAGGVADGREASASRRVSSCRGVAAASSLVSSLVLLGSQSPGLLCVPGRARGGISFFWGSPGSGSGRAADSGRPSETRSHREPLPFPHGGQQRSRGWRGVPASNTSSGQWPQSSAQLRRENLAQVSLRSYTVMGVPTSPEPSQVSKV